MKKLQTYQKVAIILVIVAVAGLVGVNIWYKNVQENRDPLIVKYAEVMTLLAAEEEPYHAKEVIMTTDAAGKESGYYNEFYSELTQFLWIQTSEDGSEHHTLLYGDKEYNYSYNPNIEDGIEVSVNDSIAGVYGRPLNTIADSYYLVSDKHVSYKESEEQYIFTYQNTQRENQKVHDKAATTPIKEAVMVTYFDKEWNVEKIVVTQKWDSLAEDGTEFEKTHTITITYFDTNEQEIQARLENEYKMLKDLLSD